MKLLRSRLLALGLVLACLGGAAFWSTSLVAAGDRPSLPKDTTATCPTHDCPDPNLPCEGEVKEVFLSGLGTFETTSTGGSSGWVARPREVGDRGPGRARRGAGARGRRSRGATQYLGGSGRGRAG